jgi:hypothetical protein
VVRPGVLIVFKLVWNWKFELLPDGSLAFFSYGLLNLERVNEY